MRVTTVGYDQDFDGYLCSLDDESIRSVSSNGVTYMAGLSAGVHWIGLNGLPAACVVVGGPNPRRVEVLAGQTGQVAFEVRCYSSGYQPYDQRHRPE